MTPQEQMKAKLEATGFPAKEIQCYGSQIVVTCLGRSTATKWAIFLANFATVRGVSEDFQYNKVNQNTVLKPSRHKVYRVFARI